MTAALRHTCTFPQVLDVCRSFSGSDYYGRSDARGSLQPQLAQSLPVFDRLSQRPTLAPPTFTQWYVWRLTVGSLFTPVGHTPSALEIGR